jgi:hypothetical protein
MPRYIGSHTYMLRLYQNVDRKPIISLGVVVCPHYEVTSMTAWRAIVRSTYQCQGFEKSLT